MAERVDKARELVGRPLTLSEKILIRTYGKESYGRVQRGNDYVDFAPDRCLPGCNAQWLFTIYARWKS